MCAYKQEISRQNKAYFVFLLDQSFSMEEPMGASTESKAAYLATALNGWLQNMIIRATGNEGVKDWMDVSVIGYRTDMDANPIIESPLVGPLQGKMLASISDIAAGPARIEKRSKQIYAEETGELVPMEVEQPVWVDPVAEGGTPMCSALLKAYELVQAWIENHRRSFPPIVIHFTDGESQEGDPLPYAVPLKELETDDGQVLLLNCHLSCLRSDPVMFPTNAELLPDDYARRLYEMSKALPDSAIQRAIAEGFPVQPGSRGMVFNGDSVSLIRFLDMGTRIASLR